MTAQLEIVGYSNYPYAKNPIDKYEGRAKQFNFAFKNGRGCPQGKSKDFAAVLRVIVGHAATCPAFAVPCVLVPIPRSGSSRRSFDRAGRPWPNKDLAEALARAGGHVVSMLLTREIAVPQSSASKERVAVETHVASLRVEVQQGLLGARIVLVDDDLVKGSQSTACVVALRRAGYQGEIETFFVSQSIAPKPTPDQRKPYLRHQITWTEGLRLARRIEVGCWA